MLPGTVLDKRTDAFRVNTHEAVLNYDAIDVAFDRTSHYSGPDKRQTDNGDTSGPSDPSDLSGTIDPRRTGGLGGLEIIYVAKDGGDVLRETLLVKIRNIERHITELPGIFCSSSLENSQLSRLSSFPRAVLFVGSNFIGHVLTVCVGYKDYCRVHTKTKLEQRDGSVALPRSQWKVQLGQREEVC